MSNIESNDGWLDNDWGPVPKFYDQAACNNLPTEKRLIFFDYKKRDSLKTAKEICQQCPVRLDCLRYAIKIGINDSIYGGFTPNERDSIKRTLAFTNNMSLEKIVDMKDNRARY